MKNSTLFLYTLIGFTIFCAIALYRFSPISFGYSFLVFFSMMHLVLYFFLQRVKQQSPKSFIIIYLGVIPIKLLGGLALLIFTFTAYPDEKIKHTVVFLLFYFSFTAIELFFLRRKD